MPANATLLFECILVCMRCPYRNNEPGEEVLSCLRFVLAADLELYFLKEGFCLGTLPCHLRIALQKLKKRIAASD
jgi:hypothetical protein